MKTKALAKISPGLAAIIVALSVILFTFQTSRAAPIFTGNAPADFTGPFVQTVLDLGGVGDVGLPATAPAGTISGWDFTHLYFEYDPATDTMYIGIDCNGICGDADGNGDPGTTAPWLAALGGQDVPNLSDLALGTENYSLLLDGNNDFDPVLNPTGFETVVGDRTDITSFGVYAFSGSAFTPSSGGYGAAIAGPVLTLFANPSAAAPDLEFTIANFSTVPGFSFTPGQTFMFQVQLFAGSLQDDGIGEDYLFGPANVPLVVVIPAATPTPTSTFTPTSAPPGGPTSVPPTAMPTLTPSPTPTGFPSILPSTGGAPLQGDDVFIQGLMLMAVVTGGLGAIAALRVLARRMHQTQR